MADVSKFSPDGGTTEYNLKDTTAREGVATNFQLMRDGEVIEGKNKLHNTLQSVSYNSGANTITFTHNSDDSVTINGTAPFAMAVNISEIGSDFSQLGAGDYVASIGNLLPTNAGINIIKNDGTTYCAFGSSETEATFNIPSAGTLNGRVNIYLPNGTVVNNLTIYPMVCTLEEWQKSHTYEPYYVPLKDSKLDIVDQQVVGAWNMLKNEVTTQTISGITVTRNADDSLTLNGTASARVVLNVASKPIFNCPVYLSGCEGGSDSTYFLQYGNAVDTTFREYNGYTYIPQMFNYSTYPNAGVTLIVANGVTVNNVTIKPMFSTQPNTPYTPWCMSNRELTPISSKVNVSKGTEVANSLVKQGAFVWLALSVTGITENAYTTIATIPEGFRPKVDVNIKAIQYNNSDADLTLSVTATGNIQIRKNLSSANITTVGSCWAIS